MGRWVVVLVVMDVQMEVSLCGFPIHYDLGSDQLSCVYQCQGREVHDFLSFAVNRMFW